MSVPASALRKDGLARTDDGALYVKVVSGAPVILAQSFTAVTIPGDTNENTAATITVPANAMGTHGAIRLWLLWAMNATANAKTLRVRFSGAAGTIYQAVNAASSLVASHLVLIANAGATNAQVGTNGLNNTGLGLSGAGHTTSAVDTTAATTIVITAQKATAGDTVTLLGYTAELLKP